MGNIDSKTKIPNQENLLMDGSKKILNNSGVVIASYNVIIDNTSPKNHPVYTYCFVLNNNDDDITSIYCLSLDDNTPYSIKLVIPRNLRLNILKEILNYFFLNISKFSGIKNDNELSNYDIINMKNDVFIDLEKIILNYEFLNLPVNICYCGLYNIDRKSCYNECVNNAYTEINLAHICSTRCDHPFNSAQSCINCSK